MKEIYNNYIFLVKHLPQLYECSIHNLLHQAIHQSNSPSNNQVICTIKNCIKTIKQLYDIIIIL